MSGTQSTITDRFPLKKPSRHGSILSRESPADKKQKVERCSSTHDFDPTDSSSKKTKSSSEESRSETYGKPKLQPPPGQLLLLLSVNPRLFPPPDLHGWLCSRDCPSTLLQSSACSVL
ncbi:rho guanine nucleotide exchange factor 12-like, partial [Geospiza fortis]|uniref:Rho guanine nucleotide exchange factor 12-like n=1 Tax=Geospiza fortis TaxID=48883 RepID=A0A8N5F3E2_GEOFO